MKTLNVTKETEFAAGPFQDCISKTRFYPHTLLKENEVPNTENLIRSNCEFLKNQKLESEHLYLTEIPHSDINQNTFINTRVHIKKFFKFENYLKPFEYETHFHFSKLCWLTSEYIKDGKFRSYIGAHYNPRTKDVVIHPGSQRYKVVKLFNKKDTQQYLFWNTNGIKFNWLYDTDIVPIDYQHEIFQKYDFGITPDHGSIIPHFCLRKDGPMDDSSIKYFNHIQENCKKIKLKTNIKYNILKDFITTENHNSKIIFKNDEKETLWKGLLILFSGSSYEDEDVMVTVNI